jgi:hypothetical protein
MMLTAVEADTAEVVIVNVAAVLPAGTVTVAGAMATEELLLNVTVAPPVGAASDNVTAP